MPAPASAMPLVLRSRSSQQRIEDEWRYNGGEELEPLLASGAIALLDAGWLIRRASSGEGIKRRQDLEPEAFLSLDDLKAAGSVREGLPIILVSCALPGLLPLHLWQPVSGSPSTCVVAR